MVKTMTLINKDVSNQLLLKNILTPPEAIELTKLYNQLGTILKKPQRKSPNAGDRMNDYYKMLFRFMKLLSRLQFGETPSTVETPPKIPPPPPPSPIEPETVAETPQAESSSIDMDEFHSQDDILDGDSSIPDIPPEEEEEEEEAEPTPPKASQTKPINVPEILAKRMNIKLETLKRKPEYTLVNFLKEADDTFQFKPDNTIIVRGSKYDLDTLLDTAEAMQTSDAELDDSEKKLVKDIHALTLKSGVSAEKMLAKFPMLMSAISDEKRQSRSQAQMVAATRPILRESVLASKGTLNPKHIGNGRGKKRTMGSVDFGNWQKHVKKLRR